MLRNRKTLNRGANSNKKKGRNELSQVTQISALTTSLAKTL